MGNRLTEGGYANAARELGCEVAALKAVVAVEAAGAGFLDDGRPKMLFERHKFHTLTSGVWDASHPRVSNPSPGGYGDPWGQFYEALQLNAEAAVQSASWGLGQIMGSNWKLCGEKSLLGFVFGMHASENSQLMLMVQFLKNTGIAKHLVNKNWAGFAQAYNGKNYAINKYDTKLANEYIRAGGR